MKYPSNRLGVIVLFSFLALIALNASSNGIERIAAFWPNICSINSEQICTDGTCLTVSTFQRRRWYIPQDRLRSDRIKREVQRNLSLSSLDQIDRQIHLFYNQPDLSLPSCSVCEPNEFLDLLLERLGDPDHIAVYKQQNLRETITLLNEEEKESFLDGFSLQ